MRVIKNGTKTNIAFGTGFIQRIQHLSQFMVEGRAPEEIEQFKNSLSTGAEFTQPWMHHAATVVALVRDIELAAHEQGLTEDISDEQVLPVADGPVEAQ